MALTLIQFWQAERTVHEAAKTAAQADLAAAQLALVSARASLDTNAASLNTLNTNIATNRAKLPTTAVPSDLAALNLVIRDQLIRRRALQGVIFDDQDAVAWAQSLVAAASKSLARSTARVSDSIKSLASATEASARRDAMKTQLAAAPFDTLQADANAAATGAVAIDAEAEIDASFPAELRAIAEMRYATRVARAADLTNAVTASESAWAATMSADGGLAGKATELSVAFRQAERALSVHAQAAPQRYDRALAVLTGLQALLNGTKTPDLLTAQQKTDVATNVARTASETEVETVDSARTDLHTARNALDAQILMQIDADVDTLATDATVIAKRDAVSAKQTALATAQGTVTGSGDRTVMDEWQVIVEDRAWQSLVDYLDASAVLEELKATSPVALTTALDSAEDAFATALAAAAKAEREVDVLADVVAMRTNRATAANAALPARLLSAVRGDSY